MLQKTMILIKSFVVSLAFIAIFIFINSLFVNWSFLINLCVTIGLGWFVVTLWKWTSNIIAFNKSGMKLPEKPEKDDDDDIVCDPAFAELGCNVWHGTAADRTSDFWIADPFQDQD